MHVARNLKKGGHTRKTDGKRKISKRERKIEENLAYDRMDI